MWLHMGIFRPLDNKAIAAMTDKQRPVASITKTPDVETPGAPFFSILLACPANLSLISGIGFPYRIISYSKLVRI